jgi:hypothetical protein
MAMPSADASTAPYAVYTSAQAALILGVSERTVLDAARRRARNGQPVWWERGSTGNPIGNTLLAAEWVGHRCADHGGMQAEIDASIVPLPKLAGVDPCTPGGGGEGEGASRLREAEQVAEGYRLEAVQELIARLEAELADARRAQTDARADAEHWQRMAHLMAAPRQAAG